MKPKHKNCKEGYTKAPHNKSKPKIMRKIIKTENGGKNKHTLYSESKLKIDSGFLVENNASEWTVGPCF